MKDSELEFDRKCHVIYSKKCKKEIQKMIATHYEKENQEKMWERVQLQFVEYLKNYRKDLGGKKNFHNGLCGTYDCIALISYYKVCKDKANLLEIEEAVNNMLLPSFKSLEKLLIVISLYLKNYFISLLKVPKEDVTNGMII